MAKFIFFFKIFIFSITLIILSPLSSAEAVGKDYGKELSTLLDKNFVDLDKGGFTIKFDAKSSSKGKSLLLYSHTLIVDMKGNIYQSGVSKDIPYTTVFIAGSDITIKNTNVFADFEVLLFKRYNLDYSKDFYRMNLDKAGYESVAYKKLLISNNFSALVTLFSEILDQERGYKVSKKVFKGVVSYLITYKDSFSSSKITTDSGKIRSISFKDCSSKSLCDEYDIIFSYSKNSIKFPEERSIFDYNIILEDKDYSNFYNLLLAREFYDAFFSDIDSILSEYPDYTLEDAFIEEIDVLNSKGRGLFTFNSHFPALEFSGAGFRDTLFTFCGVRDSDMSIKVFESSCLDAGFTLQE